MALLARGGGAGDTTRVGFFFRRVLYHGHDEYSDKTSVNLMRALSSKRRGGSAGAASLPAHYFGCDSAALLLPLARGGSPTLFLLGVLLLLALFLVHLLHAAFGTLFFFRWHPQSGSSLKVWLGR